jgi:hypothetical protein
MKSGSWSSYQAAAPLECFGEPDDEPRRHSPPNCGACGRFVDCKPGSGARFDFTPDSVFGPERAEWICAACAATIKTPPTGAEVREAEREATEAEEAALQEMWEAEIAARAGSCRWCGLKLPDRNPTDVCPACVAGVTADEPPSSGDDIPW